MASIKFIVKDDIPQVLAAEGSTLDLLACVTYLIADIYGMMKNASPDLAAAFQRMLAQLANDPSSPLWHKDGCEGDVSIVRLVRKADDGEK